MLDLDPGNATYLQLKNDLLAAINLTQDLIQTQKANEDAAKAAIRQAATAAATTSTTRQAEPNHSQAHAPASPPPPAVMQMQLRKGGESGWMPTVGERVDALWGDGDKRFPAVVVKVEEEGEKLTLKYYGYADTEVGNR